MMKLTKIAALVCVCLPLSSYGISINGAYQSATVEQSNDMRQTKGQDNTQAVNNLRSDVTNPSIHHQTLEKKKNTSMTQKNGKNNTQALNNAVVKKNTAVIQKTKLQKLKMQQEGGRNNTQAINNIHIKR